jgi:hypothetical protein
LPLLVGGCFEYIYIHSAMRREAGKFFPEMQKARHTSLKGA